MAPNRQHNLRFIMQKLRVFCYPLGIGADYPTTASFHSHTLAPWSKVPPPEPPYEIETMEPINVPALWCWAGEQDTATLDGDPIPPDEFLSS
jgi:hypothetical protein